MATYKVYRKGNYIIVEDSANKYWEEIALNTKISKEFVDSTSYTITFKDVKETWTMPFADIREADGTTYADVATWETWYTANTGFNAATTESVAALALSLSGKQDILVSSDNIKTINGASLLGSGNLVIAGGTGSGPGDMTMAVYDPDGDGVVDAAEVVPVVVRNTSSTITLRKGTIVYLSGSTGYRPNAYKAQANAELTSSGTFGAVLSDIAPNSDGQVASMGTVHDLDTRNTAPFPFTNDVLVDGDILWLDPANAGYVTKTKPQAPNHIVFIGIVARTSPTLGRIIYRISNGFELEELHNVFINGTLADKHSLYYDAATSLWKTNTIASIIGYTPANKAGETFTGAISATNLSGTNTGDQDLSGLVVKNAAITGATKTKVTYDAKGLVTVGADATTADIADSTNKRYVTDANLVVIGNTSGANTGDNAVNSLYSGLAASKQNVITLTTTGTSGTATLVGSTINVPQYANTNIYNSNGVLITARSIDLNGKNIDFTDGIGTSTVNFSVNDGGDNYANIVQNLAGFNMTVGSAGFSKTLYVDNNGVGIYSSGTGGRYNLPNSQPTANQIPYAASAGQLGFTSVKTINGNSVLGSGNISVGLVTTLTTTGTSGAATLVSGTLNIPQYSGGSGSVPQSIINSSLIFYSNNC